MVDGVVTGAEGADFMPREFHVVDARGAATRVWTTFWYHQSCVRDGDAVRILGSACSDGSVCVGEVSDHIAIG